MRESSIKNLSQIVIAIMAMITIYQTAKVFAPEPVTTVKKMWCKDVRLIGNLHTYGQAGQMDNLKHYDFRMSPGVYEYCAEEDMIGAPPMDNYIPTPLFVQCMKAVEQHKEDICK